LLKNAKFCLFYNVSKAVVLNMRSLSGAHFQGKKTCH
jgi:hypothetical protein